MVPQSATTLPVGSLLEAPVTAAGDREIAPMPDRPSAERTEELIAGIDPQGRYKGTAAAAALGIKPGTLYSYRSRGQIPEPTDGAWTGAELIEHLRARHQGAGGGRPRQTGDADSDVERVTMRLSLPDDLAEFVRVEAARRGTFPSAILEEAVQELRDRLHPK